MSDGIDDERMELTVREHMIQRFERSDGKVEALSTSTRELKLAVEELIDRVDSDIDALRSKTESLAVLGAGQGENTRRIVGLEAKVSNLEYRVWSAFGGGAALVGLLHFLGK